MSRPMMEPEVLAREDKKCPECGSRDLVRDDYRAELVCNSCGLVIEEDIIDQGPDWRNFNIYERYGSSRVGSPANPMIPDKGLSTEIPVATRDAHGKSLSTEARVKFYRMRMLHNQVRQSKKGERSLGEGLKQVDRFASLMRLPPSIREEAAVVYRKAAQQGVVRGRSIAIIAAASIYVACRLHGFPRTLREIVDALKLDRKKLSRTYTILNRELKLRVPTTSPEDYLPRISEVLELESETRTMAARMVRDLSSDPAFASMLPTGTVAGAVYIASILCDDRRSQDEISKAAGVSEVTLRNRARQIAMALGISPFPPEGKSLVGWKSKRYKSRDQT
ncbi:MAG: transcription initiation factor IIB family protein [Thermoplasmata archaeon]